MDSGGKGRARPTDRAGGLRPEPPTASQPIGAHPSRGYYVVTYYRVSQAGSPPEPYVETKRKWYRWKWRAKLELYPRLFVVKICSGMFAFVLTEMIPAQDIRKS